MTEGKRKTLAEIWDGRGIQQLRFCIRCGEWDYEHTAIAKMIPISATGPDELAWSDPQCHDGHEIDFQDGFVLAIEPRLLLQRIHALEVQ